MRNDYFSRAFTLVELLIAVALVALLSVFLFSILDATTKLWKDNESRVDSYREARAALNFMARELGSLHAGEINGGVRFLLDPDTGALDQSKIAVDPAWASRIFFLATLPADAQDPNFNRSDLCTVGYFLAHTRDRTAFSPGGASDAEGSYKLFRHFRSSDPTFDILTGVSADPLFLADPESSTTEVLAAHVSQFKITPYEINAGGLPTPMSPPLDSPPDFVELSITALNERDAARLTGKADWENHASDLHTRSARTFTTRVRLPQPAPTPTPTPTPAP